MLAVAVEDQHVFDSARKQLAKARFDRLAFAAIDFVNDHFRCGVGRRYWPIVKTCTPDSRKSSIVWNSSISVSPSPSITPLFVTISGAISFARLSTASETRYFARERTSGVRRSHVSTLWLKIC